MSASIPPLLALAPAEPAPAPSTAPAPAPSAPPPLRAGIIGLDTSHVLDFSRLLNDPQGGPDLAGVRVVAGYPGGSPDVPASRDRVAKFTGEFRKMGLDIVDSVPALLEKVDVVLLESLDGRRHLEQARAVFEAGKPVFIDKPLAGSLADAVAIADLARRHHAAWFSSSALRFGTNLVAAREKAGAIQGCDAWSPCTLEPTHPDLFWYGVHGVELLYTVMGTGCETVSRVKADGAEVAVGVWKGGRVGTFRGIHHGKADYGAVLFGTQGIAPAGAYEGYRPLVVQIARFFRTRQPPVPAEETIEMFAFMEAADESKRQGGRPAALANVLSRAQAQAREKVGN